MLTGKELHNSVTYTDCKGSYVVSNHKSTLSPDIVARYRQIFDQQFKQLDQAPAVANMITVMGVSRISTKVEFVVSKDTQGLTLASPDPKVGKIGANLKYDKTKTSTNSLELVYK